MSKTLWVGIGCLVLFVASLGMCFHLASLPQVMSATDGPPPTITWASLWGMIASGTFIPMVVAFVKAHQSQIDTGLKTIQTIATPLIGDKAKTAMEAVSAALAYAANRSDPNARSRFIMAELAEIRDILTASNPAIAGPLNALVIAITNAQFPAETDELKQSVLK